MVFLRIFVFLLCLVSSFSAPNRFVDRDEQQFIDHLVLDSRHQEKHKALPHPADENDELETERLSVVNLQNLQKSSQAQNSKQFHLIKKAAAAVVKRLSMPSPPKTDYLIDKAVQFVFKESHPVEHARIKSAIKEQVDKMIFKYEKSKEPVSKPKSSGLREDKILTALEDILSELAVQLNLTTLQVKFLVNTTVNVLAKHFGLRPWQNHELHERVTSHVRAKLKYEDWDNKDARLRRLEEKIEKEIINLKLTDKQARRLEALMIEEEAIRESLSKDERLRMLKRVIADIKDDFKTEKLEQESGPPKLSSVNIIVINNLIRQKALEMQLNKKELKVLGLAILTAIENLTMHTSSTASPKTQETRPTKATFASTKTSPVTMKETKISSVAPTGDDELELEGTKPTAQFTKKETEKSSVSTTGDDELDLEGTKPTAQFTKKKTEKDKLQEELEGTKPPTEHHTTHTSYVTTPTTERVQTSTVEPSRETITEKRRETDDDLIAKLAQDEAELEEKEFRPKPMKETKDEVEMELEEGKQHERKPSKNEPKDELELELEEKKQQEKKPSKVVQTTAEAKPTKACDLEELTDPVYPTTGNEVTQPYNEQLMETTLKPAKTHSVSPTEDKEFEEDILEGRVTKPANGHTAELNQPKTEKLIVTTPKTIKTEEDKPTKKVTKSSPTTEDKDKKLEEDLLESRVTNPTNGHTVEVTQHKTEHQMKKSTPKSTTAEEKKQAKEMTHSIPPTDDVDKKLEEDRLEGRVTTPSCKTHIKHSPTEHIRTPTKEPEPSKEVNEIVKKNVHSRRHRVKIMEDDAELEELGLKKSDNKDDTSLEDDLNLLEKPEKTKSLEDELDEVLSKKEAKNDELLEDELKDLSVG